MSIKNVKELREEAAVKAKAAAGTTMQERIANRMYLAWGEWQPDYEGWLKWSNGLYAEDAMISAIGSEDQRFRDCQASMKEQRDRCTMEMGPILQMTVGDNVAALVYEMYLTPKGIENAPTFSMMVTEFNRLEEVDGRHLYTDGGNLNQRNLFMNM